MKDYELYFLLGKLTWAFFVFAFGSCVGSLINVLVYRLPLGLSVMTPPSRCPACETRLTWRENIPIFGWIILRGKCRFCRSRISPEYPIVEAVTGLLFLGVFALWYLMPHDATLWGIRWGDLRPHWTYGDLREGWPRNSWPLFVIMLGLLGSLVAMTIVDAKTFTIPLAMPWFATVVGLAGHPLFALYCQYAQNPPRLGPFITGGMGKSIQGFGEIITTHQAWIFPTPATWPTIYAAIAGVVGIGVSMLLVRLGIFTRSFSDYDEWEKQAHADAEKANAANLPEAPADGGATAPREKEPTDAEPTRAGPEMWIQYPHARREMIKEMAFVAPCVLLGYATWYLLQNTHFEAGPSLFMQVLGGVLLGYLIGGGIVWLVRIGGSLGFGKEAMGLGDVHLMAAVGACLGWQDSVLGFFGAAFVGILWVLVSAIFTRNANRALPYGPYLAISTVLILLLKPWVSELLGKFGLGMIFE